LNHFYFFLERIIEKKANNRPASSAGRAEILDKIVSLAKRRGFVFQSSEIYGGLNGCWDYGPLGVELLRNIKGRMVEMDDLPGKY
jgi:hypothetical protein